MIKLKKIVFEFTDNQGNEKEIVVSDINQFFNDLDGKELFLFFSDCGVSEKDFSVIYDLFDRIPSRLIV